MADSGTATHLSIGEVLGLLLEEFPDITISKIRFLESQGLIAPERTPSGYRKFFDDDVELLRLILREQREKFLPLRVIKDRLDSGQIEPDPTPPRGANGGGRDRTAPMRRPAVPTSTGGAGSSEAAPTTPADDATTAPDPAPAAAAPAASADTAALPMVDAPAESVLAATSEPAAESAPMPAATSTAAASTSSASTAATSAVGPSQATVDKHPAAHAHEPSAPVTEASRPTAPAASPGSSAATSGTAAASATARLLPGVLLNREELCAMASITDSQLGQLEEYGVVAKPAAGGQLYGEDAVEVAAAAGGFLRAGVDARHLRGWRHSVDREVGLYEQLVLPVLRQRNPQARAQVAAQLQELDALGARLRSAMTRAALRRYVET